jgi:transcriptional regulator with XRE-family HTH domain
MLQSILKENCKVNREREELRGRVKRLRQEIGLSQEELASHLGISRTALSQVESGERKLSAEEAGRLAQALNVSSDVLLGLETEPEVTLKPATSQRVALPSIRISVPQKDLQKFKQVLLYILDKVGAKPNVGETVLYKLLYFIDFDYYEIYEEQLVGATYIRNRHGPTPVEFKKVVDRMKADGDLTIVKQAYFDFPQRKYLPLRKPDLRELRASELKVIDEVLDHLSDMNAKTISAYSHGDVPWLATEAGRPIAYEAVFYRTPSYSRRSCDADVP